MVPLVDMLSSATVGVAFSGHAQLFLKIVFFFFFHSIKDDTSLVECAFCVLCRHV